MSDVALAELMREVVSRPYEERVELLNSIAHSLRVVPPAHKKTMSESDARAMLDSFMGRSRAWDGVDILEYQRQLRGEYRENV